MGVKTLALKVLAEAQGVPTSIPRGTLDRTPTAPLRGQSPIVERLWSPGAFEAVERFGQAHARLFPFIGKRIWTPDGAGELLSVFAEQCEILLDGSLRTARVLPEDVRPIQ